jgi:iron-sulfur cluster assembly accessory protein
MITLTPEAVIKVKEIGEAEGLPLSIRAQVRGGSCAGFVNDMCFDEIINDLDEVIEQDGIKIIVDQMSLQYLEGTTIDYSELEFSTGFVFRSDNIKATCGCRKSVQY